MRSSHDPLIPQCFTAQDLLGKARNKAAVQPRFGLPVSNTTPLIGVVGRLVEQKGIDLVAATLPALMKEGHNWPFSATVTTTSNTSCATWPHVFRNRSASISATTSSSPT